MQIEQLIKKINYSYKKFLESYVLLENFSLIFKISKISIKWNENIINSFQLELKKIVDKYEWLKLNTISTVKWTIIESIEFENIISYLKFINKHKDFNKFCKNINYINSELIIIKPWIEKNIYKINENEWKWENIIKVMK